MKQNITKDQWNELTPAYQSKILKMIGVSYIDFNHQRNIDTYLEERFSIGQMIEFLGDNLDSIESWGVGWDVNYELDMETIKIFDAEELCDALFKAVKYKLKQ